MKKLTITLLLLCFLATSSQGALSIGLSAFHTNYDGGDGTGFAPNVGWQFTDNPVFNHSIEGEVGFISLEGSMRNTPILANYLFSWNPTDLFGLYSGLGLGFSLNDYKAAGDDTEFAWQLQLGFRFSFTENYHLNLGYRYLDIDKLDHSMADLGFRYRF